MMSFNTSLIECYIYGQNEPSKKHGHSVVSTLASSARGYWLDPQMISI